MNVTRGLTTFLKVMILLAGIAILALCIFLYLLWLISHRVCIRILPNEFSDFHCDVWIGCTFYIALYQAFNLLRYIEANTAFSELSVKALKYIKWCAIIISGLHVLGAPLFIL